MRLRLESLTKRFGAKVAVESLSLDVGEGELFAVLGPSGCGKTTALRMVAGFVEPDSGRILFGDRDVTPLPPEKRDAAMVFQSYALFPHLDVGENVAFGLEARKVAAAQTPGRIAKALELVGLAGYERRAVGELSGGEQQRTALARAIVVEPPLLLLDEPMSNLDPKLREGTRRDLRALQRRLGITALYVTHDQQEALEIADRIALLEKGKLIQTGPPRDVYDRPETAFVATFLGRANVIETRHLAGFDAGGARTVAVRPESIALDAATGEVAPGADGAPLRTLGRGTVKSVEFQGETLEVKVELETGAEVRVLKLNTGGTPPEPGARVRLSAPGPRVVSLKDA